MVIALIGYGKMGKAIEKIALERGHKTGLIIDADNAGEIHHLSDYSIDVAIEFSQPNVAMANIKACINQQVPVISGTTGWLNYYPEVAAYCREKSGTFLSASNFSLGVNLFFKLNQWLGTIMARQEEYNVELEEVHHTQKLDKPSGTAITLAEKILSGHPKLNEWVCDTNPKPNQLHIRSIREPEVPGTHIVTYDSPVDTIEVKHIAKNRTGFALGAVMVAEWIRDKQGVYTMDDYLNISF